MLDESPATSLDVLLTSCFTYHGVLTFKSLNIKTVILHKEYTLRVQSCGYFMVEMCTGITALGALAYFSAIRQVCPRRTQFATVQQ